MSSTNKLFLEIYSVDIKYKYFYDNIKKNGAQKMRAFYLKKNNKNKLLLTCLSSQKGLSLLEVICAVAIVGILSAVATYGFIVINQKAYTTVARYDARRFLEAQKEYYYEHDVFFGTEGDIISGNPAVASTITIPNFQPSGNVILEIISVETKDEPFTVQIRLKTVSLLFEFNRTINDFELIELEPY